MGPMFPYFAEEFKINEIQQSLLTGACVIGLGFANLIIVPISNILGRRQACLIFCILGIATCIWQALSQSYAVLIAARAINGVATATSETTMMQVVADMFFLHERGLWTGIYL
jgi:Arabinose efflux permease